MTNGACVVDECPSPSVGKGLCSKHWQRMKKYGSTDDPRPSTEQRFWAKVDKTGDCWLWTGHRKPDGYGRWRFPTGESNKYGKQHYVHRVAWEFTHGPIPEGVQLDHTCHNTSCVRPDHLRITTAKQNQEHRIAANRGNKSGVRGVTRTPDGRYWMARVRHQGKNHYAGSYKTAVAAEAAVIAKRRELFTHSDMDVTAP